jgi:hypothetical protein
MSQSLIGGASTLAVLQSNSKALWYLTRGFGLVSLLLLTLTMVLGLSQAARYARPGLPRFVISALHKNASLIAVTAIAVHVATSVMDSYAPIRVVDAFVPFVSAYRPIWTGLGALALDLLVALVVTSLLRERLGHRGWRIVHWCAYACWPVALVHGIGTGSDAKLAWVQLLYVACCVAVVGALWFRVAADWSGATALPRVTAVAASVAVPLMVAAWAVSGPLSPGWARKAGTPLSLLGARVTAATSGDRSAPSSGGGAPSGTGGVARGPVGQSGQSTPAGWNVPFTASFRGSQSESSSDQQGSVSVTIRGSFNGQSRGDLLIVITGEPLGDGGVSMTSSAVTLRPGSSSDAYRGQVTQLDGTTVVATLRDGSGRSLVASVRLQLQQGSSALSGTISVQP